jgi:HK97 family phage major capsid protein
MCLPIHLRVPEEGIMKNPVQEQLDSLRAERDQARDAAIQLASAEDFDPQDKSFTELEARAEKLDGQIERLVKLLDAQKSADALEGRMARSATRTEERAAKPDDDGRDWGARFVESEQYRSFNFRGTSQRLDIETRALPHSLASMDDALPSQPIYDLTPTPRPNLILPLVNQVQVSGNGVEYITWTKTAGDAAVVPEGTLKPSIEWTPTVSNRSLVTIAAHTSMTRQLAEDAAAVRSYLTGELQNEVRRKVEAEAVAAIAGATLPTATGPAGAGLLGAIRKGLAEVQANGFAPNGFLVSVDDLIALDIEVMGTAGTAPNQTNSYWGLRPIVDTSGIVAAGQVIVGDFKAGVTQYSRNQVSLYATDSHAENFRLNILDFIAETRALTAVVKPDALVEATAGV